jgi:hypothetical protein
VLGLLLLLLLLLMLLMLLLMCRQMDTYIYADHAGLAVLVIARMPKIHNDHCEDDNDEDDDDREVVVDDIENSIYVVLAE